MCTRTHTHTHTGESFSDKAETFSGQEHNSFGLENGWSYFFVRVKVDIIRAKLGLGELTACRQFTFAPKMDVTSALKLESVQ